MPTIHELLDRLWTDYVALNPHALAVREALQGRGETIVNDHIALRTFDEPRIGLDALAAPFVEAGYTVGESYHFTEKKLFARHYEHPDPSLPLLFVSELKTDELPAEVVKIIRGLIAQLPRGVGERWDFPVAGRLWNLTVKEYETLARASEYAGWLGAFGFHANHFTVLVNALKTFDSLAGLNAFLVEKGFELNTAGGAIKGSPTELLEQSSTLAGKVTVKFLDGERQVPACYYEFARRYEAPATGRLFRGFVVQSADKIFQSTDRR